MIVKFKSTTSMRSYHDLPHSWVEGDTREVAEERAKYLIKDYPDNFAVIKSTSSPELKPKK